MEEEKIRYLFDASALYPALRIFKERLYGLTKHSAILDLTFYEIGNTIITEFKRGSIKDWGLALRLWASILKRFKTFHMNGLEEIGEIAVREDLTFYDASYIQASKIMNLTLISNDNYLLTKAANYIKVMRPNELSMEQ
ncbi:MAG: type II toxin-antitoxin system VapC family toxin [Candidatus Bathyarchaeia archaeon]